MSRLATSSTVTPVSLRDRAQVDDALVRDEPVRARVEHRVVRREAVREVVRVRGSRPAWRARSPSPPIIATYIHGIGRMPAEPHGAALIAPTPVAGPGLGAQRMVRQERREVRAHADRADAGTAAAVRDAERLVQVQVRHVGAELAGPRDADERVEVRAVEVHLAAVVVHERADLADLLLEHAVRRRIRDHRARRGDRRARPPWPSGRRGRRCRGRRTRRRPPACRPSRPTPRSCRAPTRGSGTPRAATRRATSWYLRIASSPAYSPCEPAFGCSDTAS